MLDAVRYLVVYNPLILVLLHYGLHFLGLERHIHHRAPQLAGPGNATALTGTLQEALPNVTGNQGGAALAGLLGGAQGAAAAANATRLGVVAQAAGGGGVGDVELQ